MEEITLASKETIGIPRIQCVKRLILRTKAARRTLLQIQEVDKANLGEFITAGYEMFLLLPYMQRADHKPPLYTES